MRWTDDGIVTLLFDYPEDALGGLLPSFYGRKQPLLFASMLPEGFRIQAKRTGLGTYSYPRRDLE
jgi:hypothetical protein